MRRQKKPDIPYEATVRYVNDVKPRGGFSVDKYLSLNYEEATALLEMSMFSYLDDAGDAGDSALAKLGDMWREFCSDGESGDINIAHKLARAA